MIFTNKSFLARLFVFILFFIEISNTLYAQKKAYVQQIEDVIPLPQPSLLPNCVVSGITVTASGTLYLNYSPQINANGNCAPSGIYTGIGAASSPWIVGGNLTYTFSSPVTSARISYSIFDGNSEDFGYITINGCGNLQLTNPCGVTISGNMITGSISSFTNFASGNVSLTVSSNQPFTSIKYSDDSGSGSLIKQGNLCDFILTPYPTACNLPTPILSATNINIPCLATTVDLNSITASNIPNSNCTNPDILTWHSGDPASLANTLSSTIVGAGTYYASILDPITNCYSDTVPVVVTATPLITPTFSAVAPICSGAPLAALPTTSLNGIVGTWSALNNTATSTYTFTPNTSFCATTAYLKITVNDNPILTGPTNLCMGSPINLTSSTAGSWTSSNIHLATINSSTGLVTEISTGGPVTITFTDSSTGCSATKSITVNPIPVVSGATKVCIAITAGVTPATGGFWSSNCACAAVTNGGVVTGIAPGTATLTFTNSTTGCSASRAMTVLPKPIIVGATSVCVGSTVNLTANSAGSWTSSNIHLATINSATGLVTGIAPGTDQITFSDPVTTCSQKENFYVYAIPNAGTLSGIQTVCLGNTVTFSSTIAGGTWSSNNTAIASVDATTGIITGNGPGTTTITYTVTANGCSSSVTRNITVNPNPNAGILSGTQTVCLGNTVTFSSTITGGTWSSNNIAIASINATSGVITGNGLGNATITYTVNASGCTGSVPRTINVIGSATLLAYNDTYSYGYLQSSTNTTSILNNDYLNGTIISPSAPNITVALTGVTPTFSNGGITLNADGTFTIQPYTAPGTYVFSYQLSYPCAPNVTSTATITIAPPTIEQPGKYQYYPSFCFNQNSQTSSSGFYDPTSWGDTIGVLVDGAQASPLNLSIVPVGTLPTGLTLNANGTLSIVAGLMPNGNYSFDVMLYPKGTTINGVGPIPVAVFVNTTIYAQVDQITFDTSGNPIYGSTNVLDNDGYFSNCTNYQMASLSNVSLLQTSLNSGGFSIDAFGGVSSNVFNIGYYTLTYQIRDLQNTMIFMSANVEISVVNPLKMSNNNLTNFNHFQNVIISPNPSHDVFTVNFVNFVKEVKLELCTLVGQKILEETIVNKNEHTTSIDNLAVGTYLLKLSDGEQTIIKKIIKK